jgi:hypothetical protein
MDTLARRALVVAFVFAGLGAEAGAQAPRPTAAVFGGSAFDPKVTERLDLSLSVAGAYDGQGIDDTAGVGIATRSPLLSSGFYNSLTAGLNYSWTGRRAQLGATAGASGRYYEQDGRFLMLNDFVSAGLTSELTRRISLAVNQSVSYSPAYFNSLVPGFEAPSLGAAVGAGSDYSLGQQQTYLYDTTATLSRTLSSRSSLAALADYRFSAAAAGSPFGSIKAYGVGGRYTRTVSNSLALRLGYVYREGQYGAAGGQPTAVHDIDAGVDYKKALSFSKRTKVNFSVGSIILNSAPAGASSSATALGRNLQFGVTGNVGLTEDIGRTWRARVMYDRGLNFSEAFRTPVFADSIRATFDGLFSKRADFKSEASAVFGEVGYNTPTVSAVSSSGGSGVRNYQGSARVRFGLTSWAAAYTEYVYYRYSLGTAVAVGPGIPSLLNRNSVRLGMTFWAPLLRK